MTYNVLDAAKDLLTGEIKFVDPLVAKARLDTCKQCDAYNKIIHVCTVCKCFMPAKTKLEQAACPMEMW